MTRLLVMAAIAFALTSTPGRADVFTFLDEDGKQQTVAARLAGEGQQHFVLEKDDGEWILVPAPNVRTRTPGEDPVPITAAQMAGRLEARFTKELFRYRVEGNAVVGFVMMAPLDPASEGRLKPFLDKAVGFTQQVTRVFDRFCDAMKLETQPVRFPQVLLIFEHDDDFEKYAKSVMQGEKISVANIAGFYSALSNWLAIRMDECDSFAVPLHEAIHQLTFNRGLLQRLAPVPVWFSEGIATGFENAGNTINTDPTKINRNFATRSIGGLGLTFSDVITKDASFQGDVTTADSYTRAWALHWLLVTDRPKQYAEYFRGLGRLKPLGVQEEPERLASFRRQFDLDPAQLEQVYRSKLQVETRKQNIKLFAKAAVGNIVTQDNAGIVEIGLVRRGDLGNRLAAIGKIRNLNPVRSLTFRVALVPPNEGAGLAWFVGELGPGKTIALDRQLSPVAGDSFRVEIRAALPDSKIAAEWKAQAGIAINKGKSP